jgi:uncharacterized iron-regulated membrane protein
VKLFRKILFWSHLVVGLAGGLVIAFMAFTGATMAFENQIVAALERDARFVTVPPEATRLPIDDLIKSLRAQKPDAARPQSVTVSADPAAAVVLSIGREETYYANPYTAEIREPSARSKNARAFFHLMEMWHRWFAREGDQRIIGKAITGAASLVFLSLVLTGLWLWIPRQWTRRALRPSLWFTPGARGKARDWNWHNVIGLWTAPAIIVTTLTGTIMSYSWANNLLYRAAGSTPPAEAGARSNAPAPIEFERPAPGARPLGFDALLEAARAQAPADWSAISLRSGTLQRGARGGPRTAPASGNPSAQPTQPIERPRGENRAVSDTEPPRPRDEARAAVGERERGGAPRSAPQPVTATIRADSLAGPLQLTLNPYTAGVLRTQNPTTDAGRRLRALVKPLHTGTLGGWPHQLVMFLSAIGAIVLVYTGFALAFRRFFFKRRAISADSQTPAAANESLSSASR